MKIDIEESPVVPRNENFWQNFPANSFNNVFPVIPQSRVPSVTDLQPRFRRYLRRLTPELNCHGDEIKRIEKRSGAKETYW